MRTFSAGHSRFAPRARRSYRKHPKLSPEISVDLSRNGGVSSGGTQSYRYFPKYFSYFPRVSPVHVPIPGRLEAVASEASEVSGSVEVCRQSELAQLPR